MKIAIITLSPCVNYGGILQAYALQTVLSRMGHSVRIRRRSYRDPITIKLVCHTIPKRILLKFIGQPQNCFKEFKKNREYNITTKWTTMFINKYLKSDYRHVSRLKEKSYDAYIVGSDQIWRPKYVEGDSVCNIFDAFLGFTKAWNVKRVAYAASFGTSDWEYSENLTKVICPLIQKFDAVSVREESGVLLCKEHLGVNATWMPDPTLLLQKEDYLNLIDSRTKSEGTLFAYILDKTSEKQELINQIAREKKLKPFFVSSEYYTPNASIHERIQPPVEKWLAAFRDAEFVITDSFHGSVFSIIFGKPFVAIGNHERGLSRFETLLSKFNLEDHLLSDTNVYDSLKDYSFDCSSRLMEYRKFAETFLNKELA